MRFYVGPPATTNRNCRFRHAETVRYSEGINFDFQTVFSFKTANFVPEKGANAKIGTTPCHAILQKSRKFDKSEGFRLQYRPNSQNVKGFGPFLLRALFFASTPSLLSNFRDFCKIARQGVVPILALAPFLGTKLTVLKLKTVWKSKFIPSEYLAVLA